MSNVKFWSIILLTYSLLHCAVHAATPSDSDKWDIWEKNLRSQFALQSIILHKRHPEFTTVAGGPCTIGFEVTAEHVIKNISFDKKNGNERFDSEAGSIVFFQRHSNVIPFPDSTTDSFIKCQVSFYPGGNVSLISIKHPKIGEIFKDKSESVNSSRTILLPPDFALSKKDK